ncbi:hypothetical protein CTI14_60680, partial [Methylobacterium radiotolerans]
GVPKGAMLTHENLVSNAEQCRMWMSDLKEGQEVTMAAIPFFHVYGMTVSMNLSVMTAPTMVLVPNARRAQGRHAHAREPRVERRAVPHVDVRPERRPGG